MIARGATRPMRAWIGRQPLLLRDSLLFAVGALAVLAQAPWLLFPLLLPMVLLVYVLCDGRLPLRHRFWGLFALFWGYYTASLYWFANAIATDLARFWWALPFALLGIPALLALISALPLWLVSRLRLTGAPLIPALCAAWLLGDWARASLLTGFPWNMVGQIWSASSGPQLLALQAASLFGVWGLTLATLLIGFGLAQALIATSLTPARPGLRPMLPGLALAVVTSTLLFGFGAVRLAVVGPQAAELLPDVALRLVQPAIPQALKWDPAVVASNLQRHIDLSQTPAAQPGNHPALPPSHVIWSESAIPYALGPDSDLPAQLAPLVLNRRDSLLIAGANRTVIDAEGKRQFWNSLFAFDGDGNQLASYDKSHLVPFGEYIPFRRYLSFLPAFNAAVPSANDFSSGPGRTTIFIPGLPPASPNICYESIFPGQVTDGSGRAQLLLTITNDGWFGHTAGPHQHLAQARLRSVEEGLPQIRVSNPGISAVIDALGRDLARLDLGQVGTVESGLTVALGERTLFARIGSMTPVILVFLSAIVAALLWFIGNRRHQDATG